MNTREDLLIIKNKPRWFVAQQGLFWLLRVVQLVLVIPAYRRYMEPYRQFVVAVGTGFVCGTHLEREKLPEIEALSLTVDFQVYPWLKLAQVPVEQDLFVFLHWDTSLFFQRNQNVLYVLKKTIFRTYLLYHSLEGK